MKRHEAQSVGQIIDRAIAATGNRDEYDRQQACFMWIEVVGPGINRYTTRRWIEGETLHVCISSASLKNELLYRKDALVTAINDMVGKTVIKDISIH